MSRDAKKKGIWIMNDRVALQIASIKLKVQMVEGLVKQTRIWWNWHENNHGVYVYGQRMKREKRQQNKKSNKTKKAERQLK